MSNSLKTNLKNIPELARNLAKTLKGGEVFGLSGPLGSGKTTFVKAVGKALKIKTQITSPTFAIINRFACNIAGNRKYLYHLDLYRTKTKKEIQALGIEEFLGKPQAVVFIEWAEKYKTKLPKNTNWINF